MMKNKQKKNSKILLTIIFLISYFFGLSHLQAQRPAESFGPPKEILSLSLQNHYSINNNTGSHELIPMVALFYQRNDFLKKDLKLNIISGGIANIIQLKHSLSSHWKIGGGISNLLFFSGDRVNIDGNRFNNDYDFNGHFFGGRVFLSYHNTLKNYPYFAQLDFVSRYHLYLDRQHPTNFRLPEDFLVLGPEIKFGFKKPPLGDLKLMGYFPKIHLGYHRRFGNESWGLSGSEQKQDQYFFGEVQLDVYQKLSSKLSLILKSSASIVSHADRLNALKKGTIDFPRKADRLFLREISADRSAELYTGFRYHLNSKKNLAIQPGFFMSEYREILLDRKRTQFAFGPEIKMMGALLKSKLDWEVSYGTIHGVHEKKWLHELTLGIRYRFKP